jgi:putative nucleotidyltransferase with HDIG domain
MADSPKAALAKVIPRRRRVEWWLGIVMAVGFALALLPAITAERWLAPALHANEPAPYTVRIPAFAGWHAKGKHFAGGGILVVRGKTVTEDAEKFDQAQPQGSTRVIAHLLLVCVLAGLFIHHMRRSNHGRLLRTQLVSLVGIAVSAAIVKALLLATAVSVLVVPVAVFAMVPTLALDRVVGLATGTLAALVMALLVPFDVGVAVVLLVQTSVAGLVIAERPKHAMRAALVAGAVATACSAFIYPLLTYLTSGTLPFSPVDYPPWLACALGPVLATALAVPAKPLYQLLVGEITHGKLVELEDLSHPLLRQIAEKSPGTWQHSLMMANMAEIAANAIGANGRLVRVGAYFHDLGKSLQPKYFIENLEPGETSPHDQLPPEVSCDAIFAHVTEGIVTARKAGLHERIVDFMHMHHGNGVLEYFWAKCREQGNPKKLTVDDFRYPGVPPQSRETAILAICDAVEAAARTLKKPDTASIDALVQRIVYGKLHLGQLDESGLSMGDLRRVADSLRETIKHANHTRIEYPWQKAQQDASATPEPVVQTGPRLDSLDRPAKPDPVRPVPLTDDDAALADTATQTPHLRKPPKEPPPLPPAESQPFARIEDSAPIVTIELDTGRMRPPNASPEAVAFAEEAKNALAEAAKDLERVEPTPGARKRAATLPPSPATRKPPSVPPPVGRLATAPAALNSTLPPPAALRAPAITMEEASDGMVRIEPSELENDAGITAPRLERASSDDVDFGTDTPVKAPTRAELQALLDSPPDPTRKQSIEEIEAIHRRAHSTAEVSEDDIEAAIELAPAARRGALGVAKKKSE